MPATAARLALVLLLGMAGALLPGCGQKGPLYLPDEAQQQNR
ncbi:lipoprotein [Thiohalobacter sp. IOR34]|nr:lipoprotein [Thiohalobacter sp. IOR34]WJW75581.1 lipoprotein [Thiohalobacter sp. IOR34]